MIQPIMHDPLFLAQKSAPEMCIRDRIYFQLSPAANIMQQPMMP